MHQSTVMPESVYKPMCQIPQTIGSKLKKSKQNSVKMKLTILATIAAMLLVSSQVSCQSLPSAVTVCQQLHNLSVKFAFYFNQHCLVSCLIHSVSHYHPINEGQGCGFSQSGNCVKGVCVPKQVRMGFVDVELLSANLTLKSIVNSTRNTDLLVASSTVRNHLGLPDYDLKTFKCTTEPALVKQLQDGTSSANWDQVCDHSDGYQFSPKGDITLQVSLENPTASGAQQQSPVVLGEAVVTVQSLLDDHNTSGQVVQLPLVEKSTTNHLQVGLLTARLTYSPSIF